MKTIREINGHPSDMWLLNISINGISFLKRTTCIVQNISFIMQSLYLWIWNWIDEVILSGLWLQLICLLVQVIIKAACSWMLSEASKCNINSKISYISRTKIILVSLLQQKQRLRKLIAIKAGYSLTDIS